MNRFTVFIFSIFIQQFLCQTAENFKTKKFDVAIFPENLKINYIHQKRFTPSHEEILKAEKALNTNLKKIYKSSNKPVIYRNLKNYKRQYVGCYDENGKKYLFINAFWIIKGEFNYWLNNLVQVDDGGNGFWNIKYYIDEDSLSDISINGFG